MTRQLTLTGLNDFPTEFGNTSIAELIIHNARSINFQIQDNDIFIITQKIISKSEKRLRDLRKVTPTEEALQLAMITGKRAELLQLILEESQEVLRARNNLIIVKHKLGFVCANAGIDHSNSIADDEESDFVLLLPENPDRSAEEIRTEIEKKTGKRIGVLIIDSHGRAWRNGTVGACIGTSGVPGIVDLRGQEDLFGYKLKATQVAAADELAAAASLLMGQAAEGIPCIIARGFPYALRESSLSELIRETKNDLFQ